MTTTIQADGLMEAGGPVWPPGALDGLFTVFHVVVVAVSVLFGLLVMTATGKLGFDHVRGTRLCHAEGSGEEIPAAFGMVIALVTGASTAAWLVGLDVGLLTLLGLGVAAGWVMVRRTTAALPAAASRESAGEQS